MLAEGKLVFDDDPLASNVRWRFAAGDPAPDAPVDGVVTDRSRFVLRTDSTVVEAMLGQADAPDPYESARQALELMHRQSRVAALEAKTAQVTGHILQETTPESSKQPKGTHA